MCCSHLSRADVFLYGLSLRPMTLKQLAFKEGKRIIWSTGHSLRTRVLAGHICGHRAATAWLGWGRGVGADVWIWSQTSLSQMAMFSVLHSFTFQNVLLAHCQNFLLIFPSLVLLHLLFLLVPCPFSSLPSNHFPWSQTYILIIIWKCFSNLTFNICMYL